MHARSLRRLLIALACAVPAPAGAQVIYTETFDAFPSCGTICGTSCPLPAASGWVNLAPNSRDWTVDSAGTGSTGTGPSVDHTLGNATGRYLYTESSNPCFGGDVYEVATPVFTLQAGQVTIAEFWYHMLGADQGTLHVDRVVNPGPNEVRTNDIIPPVTDDVDLWQQLTVPMALTTLPQRLIIRGVTGTNFTSDIAIDDFSVRVLPPFDAALANARLDAGCAGARTVSVDVTNRGTSPLTSLSVQYAVPGGAPVVETVPGPLAPSASTTYTFASPLTLPSGPATIDVTVTVPMDADATNDTAQATATLKPFAGGLPYAEDFEGGPGGWTASGTPLWELGAPADTVLNAAQSGTQAWATGLNANYPSGAQAFLESVCFDFTGVTNPRLEAYVHYEAEFSWDGLQLQTSTDGVTWVPVGRSGDPVNWYTDSTIAGLGFTGLQHGWTGRTNTNNGSDGFVRVAHDLGNGTANAATVELRFVFGSDPSVTDEGALLDTVAVFDNPPRVELVDVTLPTADAISPGTQDVTVQAFTVSSFVQGVTVQALTVGKQGTLPDAAITRATLLADDGDGIPESAGEDTLLAAPATFTGGFATFTLSPGLAVGADSAALIWVRYDLAPTAGGGLTFGAEITSAGQVTTSGMAPVTFPNGPARSPLSSTFASIDVLPFADRFDGAVPSNRTSEVRPGVFPTATSTTGATGTSPLTQNAGVAALLDVLTVNTQAGPLDLTGTSTPTFALLAAPNGAAIAAIDYAFDLSSYDATQDDVYLRFQFNPVTQTDDPADHVFLSVDGGTTWARSIFDFPFSPQSPVGWVGAEVDLSAALRASGLGFTNTMVIRFQAESDGDGVLIDDVGALIPGALRIERVPGTPLVNNLPDPLGGVPGLIPVPLTFTVFNDGQDDLTIDLDGAMALGTSNNVNFAGVTGSGTLTVPPGGSAPLELTFDIPTAGPFSLEVSLPTNDPRLFGRFTLILTGTGVFDPDIALRLEDGTPAPSGSARSLGTVRAGAMLNADYILVNEGAGALTFGPMAASLSNLTNLMGSVTAAPPASLAALQTAPLTIAYAPTAGGAFGYTLTIASNDPDEGMYVVTATGTAIAPDIVVRDMAGDVASGSTVDLMQVVTAQSQTLSFEVANLGDAPLLLGAPTVASPTNVTATLSTTPTATIAAGASSPLAIDVTPSADGPFGFTLSLPSDDPDTSTYTIAFTGVAFTPAPEIEVTGPGGVVTSGSTQDVGTNLIGLPQTLSFTVANVGTADLVLTGAAEAQNATNVQVTLTSQPPGTLAPSMMANVALSYTPQAEGMFRFDLVVPNNDDDESPFTVTVRGEAEAQAPEIAVQQPEGTDRADGATLDLGEVDPGAAQTLTFTVRNEGNADLNLTGSPAVSLTNVVNATANVTADPDATIAPAGSTTFTVEIAAEAPGAFSAVVGLPNDDGNEGAFSLALSGTARDPGGNNNNNNNNNGGNNNGGGGGGGGARDDGGCVCVAPDAAPPSGLLALGLLGLVAVRRRRR